MISMFICDNENTTIWRESALLDLRSVEFLHKNPTK